MKLKVAPIDDLVRRWRSKVKSQKAVNVTKASTSTLVEVYLLVARVFKHDFSMLLVMCATNASDCEHGPLF